jgi:hypothetical protein
MSNPCQFIKDVKKTAREAGIKIRNIPVKEIFTDESIDPYLGYFDPGNKEMAIASKRTKSSYYSILAHESSHMDQFINDKYLWEKHQPGRDIFIGWMNNEDEPDFKILEEAVQDILRVELDCERRTVEKIKKYNLPIDIPCYIQNVNADMYRYLFALETKYWIVGTQSHSKIVQKCSTKFKNSYVKIPRRLYCELKRLHKIETLVY